MTLMSLASNAWPSAETGVQREAKWCPAGGEKPSAWAPPAAASRCADLIRYGEAMRAITVIPGRQGSATLTDMPEPPQDDGPVLVQTEAIGVCGTDLEIINGDYGWPPPGQERLIIGHESL